MPVEWALQSNLCPPLVLPGVRLNKLNFPFLVSGVCPQGPLDGDWRQELESRDGSVLLLAVLPSRPREQLRAGGCRSVHREPRLFLPKGHSRGKQSRARALNLAGGLWASPAGSREAHGGARWSGRAAVAVLRGPARAAREGRPGPPPGSQGSPDTSCGRRAPVSSVFFLWHHSGGINHPSKVEKQNFSSS